MNKTYCFTDVHGQYDLWAQIRDYADETDKLIFLGDAIDRGPDGLKILQEILADDRITFLKGNHEDFLTRYGKDEMIIGLWTCSNNGGKPTYEALKAMNREDRVQLIDKVKKLPLYIAYENKRGQLIYLSHAGFTPWENMYFFEDDLLWDRNHFYEDWPQEKQYENVYVVHGHTPAIVVAYRLGQEIDKDIDEDFNIFTYADGHKICLDLASCDSKKIALYDLDEMKIEAYFYGKKDKNNEGVGE